MIKVYNTELEAERIQKELEEQEKAEEDQRIKELKISAIMERKEYGLYISPSDREIIGESGEITDNDIEMASQLAEYKRMFGNSSPFSNPNRSNYSEIRKSEMISRDA